MTEKNELEKKTKKLIRSVLLCKQEGCHLQKFGHEYQLFTGEPIPYKRLGHISLERCLQSMPDVVEFKKENGATFLSAVSDNKTKHIDVLVKEQRPNNRRAFVQHNGARPKFSTNIKSKNGYFSSKVIPFQAVSKVASLVKSHPEGIRLLDFASKYRSKYNEALLSYGYNDISGLLSSLTDVLVLKQSSTGTFYVYPKSSTGAITNRSSAQVTSAKPKFVTEEFKESLRRCISEFPDGVSVTDFLQNYKSCVNNNFDFTKYGCQSMMQFCTIFCDIFKVEKKSPDPRDDWLLFPAQTEVMQSDRQNFKDNQDLLSEETQKNLQKLLVQYPDGIILTKCLELYEQRFTHPLKVLGPTSASLADVFSSLTFADVETRPHPVNPINNIQMIKAKPELISLWQRMRETKSSTKVESEKKKKPHSAKVDCDSIVLVENLASSVTEEDLKALFSHFGQVLKVRLSNEQKGRIYMDDQASAIKAVGAFDKQILDGQRITCQIVKQFNELIENPKTVADGKLCQLKLPETVQVGEYIDVCVGEVFHPHKIYLQLKRNYKVLNDLMDDIDDFYTSGPGISKKYQLSDEHCTQIGRSCAVLYLGNMWHRGIITGFQHESQMLSIYYNDYGSIGQVPRHHAKILQPEFATLEAQAILCKLSGILPNTPDGQWPQEAGNMVLKMAQDCDGFLVAEIVNVVIHNEERTLYELEVVLYDTVTNNDPQGLIFTENLIDAGLAVRAFANHGDHEGGEENAEEHEVTSYQDFDISSHYARTRRMPVSWKKVESILNHRANLSKTTKDVKNGNEESGDDDDDDSFPESSM